MAVSLIIPDYKNPKYLDLCLKSATENRAAADTEIIVVVDGYPEIVEHVIEKYKDKIVALQFPINTGLQNALNHGVWAANNEKIFIINEDNVLPEKWDVTADRVCRNEMEIITFNQIEPDPGIYDFHVKDLGRTVDQFKYEYFLMYEKSLRQEKIDDRGGILPFCMYKKWYMIVGGWDTFFDSPFVVDWDFFLKLEMAGLYTSRYYGMHVYHFGSKSTKNSDINNDDEKREFYSGEREAMEHFTYKWGFPPTRNNLNNSHIPENKSVKGIKF